MVATRNHPQDFPEPPSSTSPPTTESPRKGGSRASATASAANNASPTKQSTTTPPKSRTPAPTTAYSPRVSSLPSAQRQRQLAPNQEWSHTPSNLTLIWLAISLPLVIWDTGYVLLRPYSMPGGFLHAPLWTPYELYGRIDHVYGFKAYEARTGWTAAQGSVNLIETLAYFVYLYLVYTYGKPDEGSKGRGAPETFEKTDGVLSKLAESRTVRGRMAVWAVLVGYSTSFLTFAKTVLYGLNEYFSGFDNIGHNSWPRLVFLWIIPNGAWIVLPAYMLYVFGQDLLEGLETASGSLPVENGDASKKSR